MTPSVLKNTINLVITNEKGVIGSLSSFAIAMLLIATAFGFVLIGGFDLPKYEYPASPSEIIPIDEIDNTSDKSLQLKTIKFKDCASRLTVNFLLDRSTSMSGEKINKLKQAMLAFINRFSDESIIGIQDFSSPENPNGTVKVLVPISYYKDVKSNLPSLISGLRADGNTHMRTALEFSRDRIKEGQVKFPDREFTFIFLSDGQPVPSSTQTPKDDLINELKKLDIRIFTIAYGESASRVKTLMSKIATSPNDSYYVPNEEKIQQILDEITQKVCK